MHRALGHSCKTVLATVTVLTTVCSVTIETLVDTARWRVEQPRIRLSHKTSQRPCRRVLTSMWQERRRCQGPNDL
jgi:hypothetical protein